MDTRPVVRRGRGHPYRDIPDSVAKLALVAYESGQPQAFDVPPHTTVDEIDQFRLDLRSAARRIRPDALATVTGVCHNGDAVQIDRRQRRDRWADICRVIVTVRPPRIGSVTR